MTHTPKAAASTAIRAIKVAGLALLSVAYLTVFLLWAKNEPSAVEIFGLLLGGGWMLLNLYAFLFDKAMSMGGEVKFDPSDRDTAPKRGFFAAGSFVIYLILLASMI